MFALVPWYCSLCLSSFVHLAEEEREIWLLNYNCKLICNHGAFPGYILQYSFSRNDAVVALCFYPQSSEKKMHLIMSSAEVVCCK